MPIGKHSNKLCRKLKNRAEPFITDEIQTGSCMNHGAYHRLEMWEVVTGAPQICKTIHLNWREYSLSDHCFDLRGSKLVRLHHKIGVTRS